MFICLFVECKPQPKPKDDTEIDMMSDHQPHSSNTKAFQCFNCKKNLYLTSIEILKHKKTCGKDSK